MAWVESHDFLIRDHRVYRLEKLLGIRRAYALGHLHSLWHFAIEFSKDGSIADWSNQYIAYACGLDYASPDANRIVKALKKSGWIVDKRIADWEVITGAARRAEARTTQAVMDKQRRRARLKRLPHSLTSVEWREIVLYFCGRCAYCHKPVAKPSMDHITAVAKGGGTTADNVVPACKSCNSRKWTRSVLEFVTGFTLIGEANG